MVCVYVYMCVHVCVYDAAVAEFSEQQGVATYVAMAALSEQRSVATDVAMAAFLSSGAWQLMWLWLHFLNGAAWQPMWLGVAEFSEMCGVAADFGHGACAS